LQSPTLNSKSTRRAHELSNRIVPNSLGLAEASQPALLYLQSPSISPCSWGRLEPASGESRTAVATVITIVVAAIVGCLRLWLLWLLFAGHSFILHALAEVCLSDCLSGRLN